MIARSPALAGRLALTLVYFFLYGPVEVALPLYVTGPLHGSAGLLGLFWTVFGIGATIGSIITYPALSATLFQRESPPEMLSQVLAARGALTVLATPLGTALGGPLTVWLGAQHTLLVSAAASPGPAGRPCRPPGCSP